MKRLLRLGLIGAGRWGMNYVRTLSALPGVSLARLGSRNPAAAGFCGVGCVVSENWRDVAAARDIDGVIVATPAELHAEMAAVAIAAGLPVMIEKPLTLDLGQAEGLLALARERGACVLVDHTHLFHPGYPLLLESARKLGTLRSITSSGGQWGPFGLDKPPLWEYGAHDVALCLDATGEFPSAVRAARENASAEPEAAGENYRIRLEFPGGAAADIRIGNRMKPKVRFITLHCDGGSVTLDDMEPSALKLQRDGRAELLPVSGERPLTRAVEAFAAAIRAGSRDLAGLELGVAVVRVLDRCRREAAGG